MIQSPDIQTVATAKKSNIDAFNNCDASVAAIQYTLIHQDLDFLRLWNEGEFDAIRKEWPDAPESVFIGADPLHPMTSLSEPLPPLVALSYRDVMHTTLHIGHIDHMLDLANKLGYPYFIWNDSVYHCLDEKTCVDTGLTKNDIL